MTITIYGKNAVIAMLKNSPNRVKKVIAKTSNKSEVSSANFIGNVVYVNNSHELNKHAPDKVHQGIVAIIEEKPAVDLSVIFQKAKTVVMLDDITDINNIGAIIRSAFAFNIDAIIVNKKLQILKKADVYKTSAGYIEQVDIIEVTNFSDCIRQLKTNGFWVLGMQLEGSQPITTLKEYDKKVIVLGAEHRGIKQLNQKLCDAFISIPINAKCDSLNVSAAAAVAFYVATMV